MAQYGTFKYVNPTESGNYSNVSGCKGMLETIPCIIIPRGFQLGESTLPQHIINTVFAVNKLGQTVIRLSTITGILSGFCIT